MTTRYVFASSADEARRYFEGVSARNVGDSITEACKWRIFAHTKLFKAVTKEVPGKREWQAWFLPIPANAKMLWVTCYEAHDMPVHGELVNLTHKKTFEHWCETPGMWRYPIIEKLTASTTTTKITELK